MSEPLAGRVVLVVGASAGIGADAARIFAADGAALMLVGRSEGPLAEIAAKLGRAGRDVAYTTGDVGGLRGSSGMGVYQASKHAVIGLTRTAAHDFGPLGIRVNAIAPGPTETPMLAQTRLAIPGGVEARIAATPLRKAGTGAEVGATASFC